MDMVRCVQVLAEGASRSNEENNMTSKSSKRDDGPTCSRCGESGSGVLFSIMSKHGFGKYCVPCEANIDAGVAAMRKIVRRDQAEAASRDDS